MKTISYCVTAWNEHEELDRLLTQLLKYKREEDEVIVQVDITVTEEVKAVVSRHGLILYSYPLNGDFATFKNHIKSLSSKDYYFLVDADEYLTDTLILNLGEVLDLNPQVDIYLVPRINTVDGLTQEHINKWRWSVNDKGWVNYPDLQTRICKNTPEYTWVGKVHERLAGPQGFTTYMPLPEGFELIHPKDIKRQEKQNKFYEQI
jgi:glycosyltransferase involved in cell wall biosynthesis